jgi:hypothetical protein
MKAKVSLAALLLVFFTVAFAGEALAYPDWFAVKTRTWSVQKAGSDSSKAGYYKLHLEVTHINNSKDRVVTNISDKYGKITLTAEYMLGNKSKKYTMVSDLTLRSSKNSQVTMTPGETYTLTYDIPINDLENGIEDVGWSWKQANAYLAQVKKWKLSYTYDCAVRSEPEKQGRRKK